MGRRSLRHTEMTLEEFDAWSAAQDQKRIMGPADAIRQGADYLVVGRPITGAPDPRAAARIAPHPPGDACR